MYFPVGARMTYTASIGASFQNLYGWQGPGELFARLKNDLMNQLPGAEELDVENTDGSVSIVSGKTVIVMQILNAGVDHADENDARSIIDSMITSYGFTLLSSSVTNVVQPGDPAEGQATGAPGPDGSFRTGVSAKPLPECQWYHALFSIPCQQSSGGSVLPSGSYLTIALIIIAVVALVLLLPGGALRIASGIRR